VEAGGSLVYLYDIEVAAAHRRRGAGRALVQALVKSCSADGVKRIWAGTEIGNAPARRTFEATDAALEGESYAEYEWELEDSADFATSRSGSVEVPLTRFRTGRPTT
jgi:ribosomal protein S18 acetylase RimI-like enzyme